MHGCRTKFHRLLLLGPSLDGDLRDEQAEYAQNVYVYERIHYSDLKDRCRQRRDCTRQMVAQISTLNSRKKLTATEVRLLAKRPSKEDI